MVVEGDGMTDRDAVNALSDCELLAHPNLTGAGCPCGHVVTVCPPPLPYPPETPAMVMQWARQVQRPHRRRVVPTIPYQPRGRMPIQRRVQQVVYP